MFSGERKLRKFVIANLYKTMAKEVKQKKMMTGGILEHYKGQRKEQKYG